MKDSRTSREEKVSKFLACFFTHKFPLEDRIIRMALIPINDGCSVNIFPSFGVRKAAELGLIPIDGFKTCLPVLGSPVNTES